MGVWCSGNIRVSKTPDEGSIPSTPVLSYKKGEYMEDNYGLKQFFREMNNIELLSAEDERKLCEEVAKGNEEAKKELVEKNLRLVVSVAKHY